MHLWGLRALSQIQVGDYIICLLRGAFLMLRLPSDRFLCALVSVSQV